ncbi:MAG: DeoR/GlpR family DNA-binding transcription regulator [Bacillota bacterium]
MLPEERRARMLELVQKNGTLSVRELAQALSVSEMTVRRDLKTLDRRGLVRRVFGGASDPASTAYEPPFSIREDTFMDEKARIGKAAASLVSDGESLILDVGTTTLEVARNLHDKHNLMVITNSIKIALELAPRKDFTVVLPGGVFRPDEMSISGSQAERMVETLYVDKLFLGTGGFTLNRGLSNFDLSEGYLRRAMIRAAKQVIVVADHSKFGKEALVSIAPVSSVHTVVSDSGMPREYVRALREMGIRVILAD